VIREALGVLRSRAAAFVARIKQKRVLYLSPSTGQVALHDPETDIVDLGDGSFTRMADIEPDDDAIEPWADQKDVRLELRRYLTWRALRMKVPKGWEPGNG
jgi:hypothetical protein